MEIFRKIIIIILLQVFLLSNTAWAGGSDLLNYRDQLKTTLAPRLLIEDNSFMTGGIIDITSIAENVISDINNGMSIRKAVVKAYKILYVNINKGAKYNVRALREMIEKKAQAEWLWTYTRKTKVVKTLWRVHLENMLVFDEVKNAEIGATLEEDKPFIKDILLSPDNLNNSLKRILKKEIAIGDITKISSNRFAQGHYKNVYLVMIEMDDKGKKERLNFILKVTRRGAIEEAIAKNNEDIEPRDVHNFVSATTGAADMLNVFGLHPESGLYFLFPVKQADRMDYRGIIVEAVKKGRTPKQVESILLAKVINGVIDTEEYNQQRANLYRQSIATYVLGYAVLDGKSISDMFPNNIVLGDVDEKNKIYVPQMVDLDELDGKNKGEFIGDLIGSFGSDENPVFYRVIFDAILDVYGKTAGREFLEDGLRALSDQNQLSYELRYMASKKKELEKWKELLRSYLEQGINDYQPKKWNNIEAVRDIAFLPPEVKAVILKVFKGQSLSGEPNLQKNILKIVNERIAVIISDEVRDPRNNIREQAWKKRDAALADIEAALINMRQSQKRAYINRLARFFKGKNNLDTSRLPSFVGLDSLEEISPLNNEQSIPEHSI